MHFKADLKERETFYFRFETFYFFLNKAINFQINEVWSVVITQQRECQQLPFVSVNSATFREVLCSISITHSHEHSLYLCHCEDPCRATHWAYKALLIVHCQVLLCTVEKNESTQHLSSRSPSFVEDHVSLRVLAYFPQYDHCLISTDCSSVPNFFQGTLVFHVQCIC